MQEAPSTSASSSAARSRGTDSASEFAQRAAQIGRDIHSTAENVHKLARLAQQTGTFNDRTDEINALASEVKEDIQYLHSSIAQLQNMRTSGPSKQFDSHSSTVVQTLKSRLAGTTQEFKDALDKRQATIKESTQRRQLYSSVPTTADPRQPDSPSPAAASSALHQPRQQQQQQAPTSSRCGSESSSHAQSLRNGMVGVQASPAFGAQQDMEADTRAAQQHFAPQQQQLMQQQQQQGFDLESQSYGDDLFLQSRAEALQGVERTIGELQGIFQQLATMVEEQGEKAARIDENIEESMSNVGSAKAQLDKYLQSISSNKWLMVKVVIVLVLFMGFFSIFVA